MPTQRGSTTVDAQRATFTQELRPEDRSKHIQAVPVWPVAITTVSSPAAADAGKASEKTRSQATNAKNHASQVAANKPTAAKQDREIALQQLRLQEKVQLERLKQRTQQRLNQRLREEQQQAEVLYKSGNAAPAELLGIASPEGAAARSAQSPLKVSPKKRLRSPSPAVRAPTTAQPSSNSAAAAKATTSKTFGRSSLKIQQLLSSVQQLPSFSSAKHSTGKGSSITSAAAVHAAAEATAHEIAPAIPSPGSIPAAKPTSDPLCNGSNSSSSKDAEEATVQLSRPAATDQPGHGQPQQHSQPAQSSTDPTSALKSAAIKKVTAYDKPWRENMVKKSKAAGRQQPATTSAAAAANVPSAAAQLLAGAAGASKPMVLQSKRRTPEQQAKLQAFMAAKHQAHLKQELEARKQLEAAAARRHVVKQLAAQQREAARQRQLQNHSRNAETFRPETSWHDVLTPSSETSRESVLGNALDGQQPHQAWQQQQRQQQQQPIQQQAWQQQKELQVLELQRHEQLQQRLHWQGQQQEGLQQLQFEWQQQQQQWQQNHGHSISSHPATAQRLQQSKAAVDMHQNQQQLAQPLQPGNETWQQYQPQQKLQRFDEQRDALPGRSAVQPLGPGFLLDSNAATHNRQQRPTSPSSERSRTCAAHPQAGFHRTSRDVSPGKAYLQDRQAMAAANSMAKRAFEQRLLANHTAPAAAKEPEATRCLASACTSSNAAASYPAAVVVAGGCFAQGTPHTPKKSRGLLPRALKASGSSGSSIGSRQGSRTPVSAGKRPSRTQHLATAGAGNPGCKQQRRQRRLQQQRRLGMGCGDDLQAASSDEYEVQDESVWEGPTDRSPSPVRDQQPLEAVAAMAAAADAAQRDAPMTALAHFWVQQHAADRKHASNSAMIQQLLLQSTMLKQRIEHICNQALKQQQQKQQQQREQEQLRQQQQNQRMRATHVSLVVAPAAIAPPVADVPSSQLLADKLIALLEQERSAHFSAAVATGPNGNQVQQEQGHSQQPTYSPSSSSDSSSSSGTSVGNGRTKTSAAAATVEQGGLLSEGSKAWQQRLRAELLHGQDNVTACVADGNGDVGSIQQCHQRTVPDPSVSAVTAEQPLQHVAGHVAGTIPTAGLGKQALPVTLEQQQQLPASKTAYSSNLGDDQNISSLVEKQQTTPGSQVPTEYDAAAYSASSSASSGLADHAPIRASVNEPLQRLSFPGAFSHLEAAAQEAAAVADESLDMPYTAPFESQGTVPKTAADHVVTWYSAVGGSLDFGSPEPPSPKQEGSLIAHQMLQAASQSAAASLAATTSVALSHAWGDDSRVSNSFTAAAEHSMQTAADWECEAGQNEPAEAVHDFYSAGTSSSDGSSNLLHGRKRWDGCTSQEQQQQLQAQDAVQPEATSLLDSSGYVQHEGLQRWCSRPSWAVAGLGGYRWDTVSSSSLSDSDAGSAIAAVPCEHIVQQHEALQQQQQLAFIPRHDKVLALDPKHQVEQVRLTLRGLDVESEEEDQQLLPFEDPAKGDPYSVINTFMRQHQERMERQRQDQMRQEQLLRDKQQQETLQQQDEEILQVQHSLKEPQLQQQQFAVEGPVSDLQQSAGQQQALLNQDQPPPQPSAPGQQQQADQASQALLAQRAVLPPTPSAVSPSDVRTSFAADFEQQLPQVWLQQMEEVQPDAPHSDDCFERSVERGPVQQLVLDMDADGVPGPERQPRRKRLSPDTLQRMHEEGLAKLETAQEAELDLLLLQQAHERVTMHQEAARVARELDQQQLFAMLQQQQHAAAREQVEQSAGLFQRVTKDLLNDTFSQLKDVSAVFAKHMRDSSRRSCGVQASEAAPDPQTAAVQAVQVSLQKQQQQQQQLQQHIQVYQSATIASTTGSLQADTAAEEEAGRYYHDVFESVHKQTTASAASGAEWSAVLPEDQPHPVLHFQALLNAEQAAAEQARTEAAAEAERDNSNKHAVGAASPDELAGICPTSCAIEISDSDVQQQQQQLSASDMLTSTAAEDVSEEMPVTAAEGSIVSIADDVSRQGVAACTSDLFDSAPTYVVATAEMASGSQQYGSSSFESFKDSEPMRLQQQEHKQLPSTVLKQQLAEVKQQLSVLSQHMDAIMIGYAVQALQAAKNKPKQAAIHQQALKEQQETAAQKQQLLDRMTMLQRQLGLQPSSSCSDTDLLCDEITTQATAAAAVAAVSQSAAHAPSRQWQRPAASTAAAQEEQGIAEEQPFAEAIFDDSLCSASPVTERSSLAAAADWAGGLHRLTCDVASSGDEYSGDFEAATEAPTAAQSVNPAAAATGQHSNAQASTATACMQHLVPAHADSSDSLDIKQQEVVVLQRKVAREYEKRRLDQQQAALQQLLQQLAKESVVGDAYLDQLLAAAGIQASNPAAGSAVVVDADMKHLISQRAHQQQVLPAPAPPLQHCAEKITASYSEDFALSAVEDQLGVDLDSQPQQVLLHAPAAQALGSASSIASSISSSVEQACEQLGISVSQSPRQLLSTSVIHTSESQADGESQQPAIVVLDSTSAETAAAESAAWPTAAAAGAAAETLNSNSDSVFSGVLFPAPASPAAADDTCTGAAAVLHSNLRSARIVAAEEAPAAPVSTPIPESEVTVVTQTTAAAVHRPVDVYSYELSASEVGTELLDDQSVDIELSWSEQQYNGAASEEQQATEEEAGGKTQPEQRLQGQIMDDTQHYSMDFTSSIVADDTGVLSRSDWAAQTLTTSCTTPGSIPATVPADQVAQTLAGTTSPASAATGSSAMPCRDWMVEAAASSSISSAPVTSILPLGDLQLRQQFRNALHATTEVPLQQAQANPVGCQSLLFAAEECMSRGESGQALSVSAGELEACLQHQDQHAERPGGAAAMAAHVLNSEVAEAHNAEHSVLAAAYTYAADPEAEQPSLSGSVGTAAAQAADEFLAVRAATSGSVATGGESIRTCNRALMRSSTTSSQAEGGYVTLGRAGSARVTADSIDLEYSDWTLDQHDLKRFSYDHAADAVPAEVVAQQQAAADISACPAPGAAAAAPALPAAVEPQQMDGETLDVGIHAASRSQLMGSVARPDTEVPAAAPAAEGDGEAAAKSHSAAQLSDTIEGQAVQGTTSDAIIVAETYSYSLDFNSMSMQQSSIAGAVDDTAVAAIAAASASATPHAVTQVLSDVGNGELASTPSSSRLSPNRMDVFGPLIEDLTCSQQSRAQAAAQLSQQQQEQCAGRDVADAVSTGMLEKMLDDVLSEAVCMWGSATAHQQPEPATVQRSTEQLKQPQGNLKQQQHPADAWNISAASASSTESADTTDTADSSAGSKSIHPDWQSTPGSPPAHLSPLSMRAAAAASMVPIGGSIVSAVPTASNHALTDSSSIGLVSHPPTDWTPTSDELTTPWSVEATASSKFGAASSATAITDEEDLSLASTVRQLDSLLIQAADSEAPAPRHADVQQQCSMRTEQEIATSSLTASSADANSATAAPVANLAAAGVQDAVEVPSAWDAQGTVDEFDWPDAEQASVASSSSTAAAAPIQRRTPSPPPLIIDDSPSHTVEYVQSVLDTQAGPPIHLPAVLALGEEPLGLDRYLWLEKDGRPDMSKLADGSDSDHRHIHHKALYDATNQAIMQLYAAANRTQLHPALDAAGPAHLMRPLPTQRQMAAEVSAKVAGWAKMRVRDEVGLDKLLADDALEDEKVWANRQTEIAGIALEVERGIWEDILADTAAILAVL